MVGGFLFTTRTAFEMNTHPVVVASVGCATQPAGAYITGLPDLSGNIDKYARGGGRSQPGSLLVLIQGIEGLGVLGMTSMNVEGIMLRSDQICIVEVFRTDLCSGWTSLR